MRTCNLCGTEVFEHVADDCRGFREVHRVLTRGGYFVFTVPLFDTERTVERAYRDATHAISGATVIVGNRT